MKLLLTFATLVTILDYIEGNAHSSVQTVHHVTDDQVRYDPTWESLDSRPLPTWYDESKVGIFIHWGVYSVPSYGSEWFWFHWKQGGQGHIDFMNKNYKPGFSYQDFGAQFTAEFYDPAQWADLFKASGAKYMVLTTKHHEGYTLWPSKHSFSWNAMDVGAHRDLVGPLAEAIRTKTDLKFGLYHSFFEWFNPLWVSDKESGFVTDDFVQFKALPELYDIVNTYTPDIVWSDGEAEATADYWKAKEFLAWLYNDSPVKGVLQPHKWENCMTLDKLSWGYRRNAQISEYLTPDELIQTLVETVSCGGNLLVNVGPTKEGIIVPIQQERLLQLGEWLGVNGDAIYNSKPWTAQNDTVTKGVWYTSNPSRKQIYAIALDWPGTELQLGAVDPTKINIDSVEVLGSSEVLTWVAATPQTGIKVTLPRPDDIKTKWAWTIVINEA